MRKTPFSGRLLLLGFGSIGQGVLPLLLKHIDLTPDRIQIVTAADGGKQVAAEYGVPFHVQALTPANYLGILDRYLKPGDFLLNLSVDVSSLDLIAYCADKSIGYLDTCIEPWPGGYTDPSRTPS